MRCARCLGTGRPRTGARLRRSQAGRPEPAGRSHRLRGALTGLGCPINGVHRPSHWPCSPLGSLPASNSGSPAWARTIGCPSLLRKLNRYACLRRFFQGGWLGSSAHGSNGPTAAAHQSRKSAGNDSFGSNRKGRHCLGTTDTSQERNQVQFRTRIPGRREQSDPGESRNRMSPTAKLQAECLSGL